MTTDSASSRVISLPKPPGRHAKRPAVLPADTRVLTDVLSAKPFDPAGTGFLLSLLPNSRSPVLWVQDRMSARENGRLYTPGTQAFGLTQPILHVTVSHPRDVLWAMEEGAACAGLSAVVGEIHGQPAVLDFTATKRLALRSETSGVPVWLIRSGDTTGGLSAARERWRIGSLPSQMHPHDAQAPGAPRWDADLFRARARPPAHWVAHYDRKDRLCLVSRTGDGTLESGEPANQDVASR
ncbi:ImuA family protein [Cognatiyoonia koreensis]|uniref:ImuA family protein n=1 Tax=Cognatiyoonia koreensis TaxID=364200 RepID=UPI000B7CB4EE|nr:hypothetical protein [Cognatiyoonia koreensis]